MFILSDLYIYFRYLFRHGISWRWHTLYWTPTLIIWGGFLLLYLRSGQNLMAHHAQAVGWFSIFILVNDLPKLLFVLCSLLGLLLQLIIRGVALLRFSLFRSIPPHRFSLFRSISSHPVSRWFDRAGVVAALCCAVGLLYGSLIGVSRLEVKQESYASADLPAAFRGYRVVQLSDLHLGSWSGRPEVIQELVERCNSLHPDLILFTGDLVNQRSCELEPFVELLSQLRSTDGIYSVLGNHDYGTYYRWSSPEEARQNLQHLKQLQEKMGWTLLNNDHRIIHRGTDRIAVVGVENEGEPPFPQYGDLKKALRGTEGMFRLLLSHNPTHWRREVLKESDVQLTLSGHTHAMQCILFGHSLSEFKYPEWRGWYRHGSQSLYVNIGIGYVGLPFRFNARPEITLFTWGEASSR